MYVYCRQGWLETYKKKIIQLDDIKVDHTRFIQTSKLTGNTCIAEPREPRRGWEGVEEETPIKCQGWKGERIGVNCVAWEGEFQYWL